MISEALQHISFINILFAITVIFVIICLFYLFEKSGNLVRSAKKMKCSYIMFPALSM